ncbi:hypothetical protein CASFOL_011408 [Castilleja foliolosa]|uniref:Uncharacterized protein n=1 Tax=Castilleja foliolosa TaxID=1961234 RepID=A0ABD3DVF8_9LAMI
MILLKHIRNRHFINLIKFQNPTSSSLNSRNSSEYLFLSSITSRPYSLSALFVAKPDEKIPKRKEPLSSFFKNAIAGTERANNGDDWAKSSEMKKLEEKLRNLEQEVRKLNEERGENVKPLSPISAQNDSIKQNGARVNLSAFFTDQTSFNDQKKKAKSAKPSDLGHEDASLTDQKKKTKSAKPTDLRYEDTTVYKELSTDMQMFVHHLYMKGYFRDANFMPNNKFDLTCFEMSHGRDFLKFAAMQFGRNHQEIARWLSASDLKKIALFGCPSHSQKSAYAVKHMRNFFGIEEKKVCQNCTLRKVCKLANKPGKMHAEPGTELRMRNVMRTLIMYAMELTPEQLIVPEEIQASVSRLMNDIVKLSQTTS